MSKKRHHYIPQAYLKPFCDEEGMVRVYRKDEPSKAIRQSPNNVGFHKYFYSQPLPDGGQDNDKLEALFSKFEEKWPPIVERLTRREDVDDALEDIFAFIALQRLRVPASRDATEKIDAETVKATLRKLDAAGELPPKPVGFEDLLDRIAVSIDPHRSIWAMFDMLPAIGQLLDRIGIGALHNVSGIPFLTSDNPVIWFDPSMSERELQPYRIHPNGPVALLFPVTPQIVIYGDSSLKEQFSNDGMGVGTFDDTEKVNLINRHICRFAYEAVFAQAGGQERLIEENSTVSRVLETTTVPANGGQLVLHQMIFGKRSVKPKWTY